MKNLKKMTIACAMVVTLGGAVAPMTTVFAASSSCSQTQSNCDFTSGKLCYNITGNNTCTVAGLSTKGENSTSCTIPSTVTNNGKTYTVTKVATNAFKNCDNLKSVKVCDTVTTIGTNAFSGCGNLSKVTLGSNVNKVCSNAFNNCSNLNKITCSNTVASTGSNCFGNASIKIQSCK